MAQTMAGGKMGAAAYAGAMRAAPTSNLRAHELFTEQIPGILLRG